MGLPPKAAVLLSALLGPACLLSRPDQGSPSKEPPRGLNVSFDPWKMNLAWDCVDNATVVVCEMSHTEKGPVRKKVNPKACHCAFQDHDLHGGANFTVVVNTSRGSMTGKVPYTNPGGEGTAAQNFSCVVYQARFMNCTWTKGPAAPEDVQYFLYIQDRKKKKERECPHYTKDSGTHVGCHLQGLSELPFYTYFLVNGTSQRTGVQFFDAILSLDNIERYSPPPNITVHCNQSHCLIQWQRPKVLRKNMFDSEFRFQLDIRSAADTRQPGGSQLVEVPGGSGTKYNFVSPEPRPRHTVRIRAANDRLRQWGDWSRPVPFGSEERRPSPVLVYALVVLGTLVCALALGYVFKRFLGLHRLSPPIPRIKDVLNENHPTNQQILCDTLTLAAGKGSDEDVVTIQEVTESTATP